MICSDKALYNNSLGVALVLMLFFAFYFIVARTPDKHIFANYLRSRRLMAGALLTLSANYAVHLFVSPRFMWHEAAVMMNLSTYYLTYWFFSCAFITLLNPNYFTVRRLLECIGCWLAYNIFSVALLLCLPRGVVQHVAMLLMALWLISYGVYLSYKIINTYHQAVRLFDDTHSDDIAAYIHWMSIFTWWAIIFGVGCGLFTFLPDRYVVLWILSSIPFYIYLFCSYLNYLLFYEKVEHILEKEMTVEANTEFEESEMEDMPAYHSGIKEQLGRWIANESYRQQGLTIEEMAASLATNRTYLSSYINTVYQMSFREWIVSLRIAYAKRQLVEHTELTVAAISEASGFLSLSHFIKIFTKNVGCSPSTWRKRSVVNG